MKTDTIRAAAPAILAIAATLLSFRSLAADSLIAAYFGVVGLGAIMALDYRTSWKPLSNR